MKTTQVTKPKNLIKNQHGVFVSKNKPGRKTNKVKRYENVGRKTKMNDVVINKLEKAFAIGATDEEACLYVDITPQTLYTYQKNNPQFLERKVALKERPILKARQTVVEALDDPRNAQWYLEKKRKEEFGGDKIGTAVQVNVDIDNKETVKSKALIYEYEEKLSKELRKPKKNDKD